jgi:hypothetical protein
MQVPKFITHLFVRKVAVETQRGDPPLPASVPVRGVPGSPDIGSQVFSQESRASLGTRDKDIASPGGAGMSTPLGILRTMDISPPSRGDLSMSTVHTKLKTISSAQMLIRAKERLQAAEHARLWDLHIQAGAVTLLVGVTSAGKTTFLHNLAYHLAEGKEFLGIKPPRPLRVLYVDYESHYGVLSEHLETIGTSANLQFVDPDDLIRGTELLSRLASTVAADRYDLILIDPLMDAYPVQDENDNAQAAGQLLAFRDLARSTRAGVVVVHNAGRKAQESEDDNAFLGRGATARSDKADIGINFVRVKTEPTVRRALVVAKSRQSNLHERIEFRFANTLGYELMDPDAPGPGGEVKLEEGIVWFVESCAQNGQMEVTRKEIQQAMGLGNTEADKKRLTRALGKLIDGSRRLDRPRDGVYALPNKSSAGTPPVGLVAHA